MYEHVIIGLLGLTIGVFITTIISLIRKQLFKAIRIVIKLEGSPIEIDPSDPEQATRKIISHSPEPQVFLAYSFKDKEFAELLSEDLKEKGIRTWLPGERIMPGDLLEQRIKEGIETSGYMIVIVSKAYGQSEWTQREINIAIEREQKGKWPKIVPILIEDVSVPVNISERVYIDFRQDYENGLKRLVAPFSQLEIMK
jgi:hypothetical protein